MQVKIIHESDESITDHDINESSDFDGGDDYYVRCPICSCKLNVQTSYVEMHPMIWCWDCESLDTKFVIDCSVKDLKNLTSTKTFDLLLVTRMANTPDMDKVLENYNKKNNTSFEEHDELLKNTNISEDEWKKQILDEVGVELNSYNIGDIYKTNPDYYLDHGGSYMLIEVLEKDGTLKRMYFWGD